MKLKPTKALYLSIALLGLGIAASALYAPDKTRAELEAAYAGPPSKFIDVLGLRVHIRDTGPASAPALILLHGFGANLGTWDAWADMLSGEYRVVRVDLPGFALTGPDPSGDYSDARSIQFVAALMDALKLDRATIVGNSMGGRIAWRFAASHPDRVIKLVLIAPDGMAWEDLGYGQTSDVPPWLGILRYVLPKPLVRLSLSGAYGDPSRLSDAVAQRYHDLLLAPGVRGAMIERQKQMVLADPEPLLKQIVAPTLLIWGKKDGFVPFSGATAYMQMLPHAKLAAFDHLGHLPQEEAAAETLPALLEFLRD